MNELGIVVDLSHCSEATTLDAIEASEHPVAITHASCAALVPHDRAKSDEVIRLLGERNGYFGVLLVPHFINADGAATLDHFLDHLDHVVQLIGPAQVGVGSDWGLENPPQLNELLYRAFADLGFRPEHGMNFAARAAGFESWRNWPNITRGLVQRGYTEQEIEGLIGGNFRRLFAEVVG
jgi:membrane dipeptidase